MVRGDGDDQDPACAKCRRHNLIIKYLLAGAAFLTAASGAAGAVYQILG